VFPKPYIKCAFVEFKRKESAGKAMAALQVTYITTSQTDSVEFKGYTHTEPIYIEPKLLRSVGNMP